MESVHQESERLLAQLEAGSPCSVLTAASPGQGAKLAPAGPNPCKRRAERGSCPARTSHQTTQGGAFSPGSTYQGFLWGCPALTSSPQSSPERAGSGLACFLHFPELSLAPHPVKSIAWKRKVGSLISQHPCFRLPCLSPSRVPMQSAVLWVRAGHGGWQYLVK